MKLDCVLTACNMNKLYSDFIPIFIKAWNKLYPNVDVKIILINNIIPEELKIYKNNIICFSPIKNISTSFISQYIRLLYPCILNYKNGILITDIDMIPLNNKYFIENLIKFNNNKWINLRDWKTKDMICIAYQVAVPNIWKEVFNINNIRDIINRITEKYKNITYNDGKYDNGWYTDQYELFLYVMKWNKKTNNYVYLKDIETKFKRLDREMNIVINSKLKKEIKDGIYSDYHLKRPYNKYKYLNDNIINLLSPNGI